jgi:hypothetical protein
MMQQREGCALSASLNLSSSRHLHGGLLHAHHNVNHQMQFAMNDRNYPQKRPAPPAR